MRKYKIIEKSRFLNSKEMNDIKGGGNPCSSTWYVSCSPNASYKVELCTNRHMTCSDGTLVVCIPAMYGSCEAVVAPCSAFEL